MITPDFNKLPKGKLEVAKWMVDFDMSLKNVENEQLRLEQQARLEEQYRNYVGPDQVISSLELVEEMKKRPPVELISSGIPGLDALLGGFVRKQVVVIAAPTKNGKTSFCIELTSKMKKWNPLWFPFEEPAEELLQKFLDRKEEPPLFFVPQSMPDRSLAWIEKKIIEAKVKFNSQIIFIDHLHFIVPMNDDRMDLRIGQAMRELKRLAKQWDVVIFLISHFTKTRMDVEPTIDDLRDSSFTAQEADIVLLLWRTTKREHGKIVIMDEMNVSLQANRRTGKTGNIPMRFDSGHFYELDKHHETNEDAELSAYTGGWNGS